MCIACNNWILIDFDYFCKALWKGFGLLQAMEFREIKAISPRAQGQGKLPNDACII